MRPRPAVLLALLLPLALAGCFSGIRAPFESVSLPASQAEVQEVADQGRAAMEQLRADIDAARDAGQAAYEQAVEAGKTEYEAMAERFRAEMAEAAKAATAAQEDAKKGQEALDGLRGEMKEGMGAVAQKVLDAISLVELPQPFGVITSIIAALLGVGLAKRGGGAAAKVIRRKPPASKAAQPPAATSA